MSDYCGCSGGGYSISSGSNGYSAGYSALEQQAMEYQPSAQHSMQESVLAEPVQFQAKQYSKQGSHLAGSYFQPSQQQAYFTPSAFLNSTPTESITSDDEEKVIGYARQAFEATTGKEFPADIRIRIKSGEELKKIHEENHGFWNDEIQGFCVNRKGFGTSYIFVRENRLAELMLTVGHEIGHAISFPIDNARDEEAKAFAFSIAWMDAILQNNIAGLSSAIMQNPARNGLHDVAFSFVTGLINMGRKALDVYAEIAGRALSIESLINA